MRKILGVLTLPCLILIGSWAGHGLALSSETLLPPPVMETAFGGANGKCCQVIAACQDPIPTCAGDNQNLQRCVQALHPKIHAQYALSCQPKPDCPKCDCADFLTDANNTPVSCLDYWQCKIVLNTCQDRVFVKSVQGYLSCADNCP